METDDIVTKDEVMSMISDQFRYLAMSVLDNYGHVDIPIHQDKLFRDILLFYLQHNIPKTVQLNIELVADQIMLCLSRSSGMWKRTVRLDGIDNIQYNLEKITNSFYDGQHKNIETKLVIHPLKPWMIELLKQNITNAEILKKTLLWCVDTHMCDITNDQEATEQGFVKEYELYMTVINHVVGKVHDKLYNNALKRYLANPESYEPDTYSTCSDFLNPQLPPSSRDSQKHKPNTCYLMLVVMEELHLTSNDVVYYPAIKQIVKLLYDELQKIVWDYRYFRTNIDNGTILITDTDNQP